jgi:hypothetical protein
MREQVYRLCETAFLETRIDYTGGELRSHFIREKSGVAGDGVIAWRGGCNVSGGSLVDLEDAAAGDTIVAREMLHFMGEHFQMPLREGNVRLRLFASIVSEALEAAAPAIRVMRTGDDLFVGDRKLTVAICTRSPVSLLFHFGINIDPTGAPVAAIGLGELGVDGKSFAVAVLERYARECESIELALRKVRGVT